MPGSLGGPAVGARRVQAFAASPARRGPDRKPRPQSQDDRVDRTDQPSHCNTKHAPVAQLDRAPDYETDFENIAPNIIAAHTVQKSLKNRKKSALTGSHC